MGYAESLRLRSDDEDLNDEISRGEPPAPCGSPCTVLKTATLTTYPTTANKFYHCLVVNETGAETEGGAATHNDQTATVKAYNLGQSVPPVGTYVIGCFVPYIWVFRFP